MQKILVWDWPVRIGHWLMVGGFIVAWLTSESETWRLVHAWSGSVVIAVALFRLPWGFIGSRYARFVEFVRGPSSVIAARSRTPKGVIAAPSSPRRARG